MKTKKKTKKKKKKKKKDDTDNSSSKSNGNDKESKIRKDKKKKIRDKESKKKVQNENKQKDRIDSIVHDQKKSDSYDSSFDLSITQTFSDRNTYKRDKSYHVTLHIDETLPGLLSTIIRVVIYQYTKINQYFVRIGPSQEYFTPTIQTTERTDIIYKDPYKLNEIYKGTDYLNLNLFSDEDESCCESSTYMRTIFNPRDIFPPITNSNCVEIDIPISNSKQRSITKLLDNDCQRKTMNIIEQRTDSYRQTLSNVRQSDSVNLNITISLDD